MNKVRYKIIIACIITITVVSGVVLLGASKKSPNKEGTSSNNISLNASLGSEINEIQPQTITSIMKFGNRTIILNASGSNSMISIEKTIKDNGSNEVIFYNGPSEGPLYDKAHSNETIEALKKLLNES